MNLLDPNIQKYIFKWTGGETHGITKFFPEIQNENEEPIGKIKIKGNWLTRRFCLHDSKDVALFCVKENLKGWGRNFIIKNHDDSLTGTVDQKPFRPTILTMKNSKGEEILLLNEKLKIDPHMSHFTGIDFKIKSMDDKIIAKFHVKQDKIKKGWLRYNYDNTCLLQIHDSNFDRKNLLGMFVCCMLSILESFVPSGEGQG